MNKYNDPNYKSDFDKFCEKSQWEESFDIFWITSVTNKGLSKQELKNFISDLLSQQKREMIEKVKEKSFELSWDNHEKGRVVWINDLITELEGDK